jgi:hypothetical protein
MCYVNVMHMRDIYEGFLCAFFYCTVLCVLRFMLAREHTTCATELGPRLPGTAHSRSNTTLSISRRAQSRRRLLSSLLVGFCVKFKIFGQRRPACPAAQATNHQATPSIKDPSSAWCRVVDLEGGRAEGQGEREEQTFFVGWLWNLWAIYL